MTPVNRPEIGARPGPRSDVPREHRYWRPDWVVVGAGFSGATVAERLASQMNLRVLVIDRRDHVAGNAYDSLDASGVRVHRYGAHIFHTKSATIWDYLSQFTEWLGYVHRVKALVDGKLAPMPCNLTTLERLLGPTLVEEAVRLLSGAVGPGARVPVLSLMEHADPAVRAMGEVVYEKLFLRYTTKQWGLRPEQLDRSVTARVPVVLSYDDRYFPDAYQGIPSDGYAALISRMLDHANIRVELGCDRGSLSEARRNLPTVYTGPIDEFFAYAYGPLAYRSLRFEHRQAPVDRAQPVAVINHPNDERFTRVIEHAHFSQQHLGVSTLTYEYPEDHVPGENEPYYPVPRSENHRRYELYAARARKLGRTVHFVGRLAEYRYYDMDQAVAHALALFEHKLGGTPAPRQRRGPLALPQAEPASVRASMV